MKKPLSGIIPPLITPLLDNDTIDVEGLERLIEHVINGGVHGIFILGTTGEAQSLSFELRTRMIKETSCILKGRLPLLVGISDTSISDSIALSETAAESNAYAAVSAPPYYYATSQPELLDYYSKLIPQLQLPLFLYNMPMHTKVCFAPSTVKKIAENEKVIGYKDSSANGSYFQTVMYEMRDHENFSMLVGPEEMTAELVLMGANGGVNGGANMFPKLYSDLYDAAAKQDIPRVRELQAKVMQVGTSIYTQGSYGSSSLKGIKCVLSELGICNDYVATPFNKFGAEHREKIRQAIATLSL